jgi:hypothetical protein
LYKQICPLFVKNKRIIMKKINQISALLFFSLAIILTGCGASRSAKGCGCPMVNKKSVG